MYDILIQNGTLFDGTGRKGYVAHVGIKDGKVTQISKTPLPVNAGCKVYDANGQWVVPGFIEIHSHYDAELMVAPALKESVRHGVTTVFIGSCSISMVNAEPEDCSDLFTRVEAVPRDAVLPVLLKKKSWNDAKGYHNFYQNHCLGPNVSSFIGHSDIRVAAMGIERATSDVLPTETEMQTMERMLEEAIEQGCLGLSMMTTKLDKLDGDRAWSKPLPSTFAKWPEFKRLFRLLRKHQAILQGAPDAVRKINVFGFLWQAHGLFRKPMKVTMLTALDLKSNPYLHWITRFSGFIANRFLRGDFRWQTLPAPFTIYLEGLDVNAFEEFSSGAVLRDIKDEAILYKKIKDPEFRKAFKKQVSEVLTVGLWHRDLSDGWILDCPNPLYIGKNFKQVGLLRGTDTVDTFFDLCGEFKKSLKWKTTYTFDRPTIRKKLLNSPFTHMGFGDSGAHIRQLAMYNFPLRMLKYVRDGILSGQPIMSVEKAIYRTTGELADWFNIEAGTIAENKRADIVIINPNGLDESIDQVSESDMEGFGVKRLVKRNPNAITATIINGKVAFEGPDRFASEIGKTREFGQFLPPLSVPEPKNPNTPRQGEREVA